MDRLQVSLLCAAGATVLALAGCTSARSPGSSGPGGTPPATGPAAAASSGATPGTPSGGATAVVASGADDGRTLTLRVGERLHVDLPTAFWIFQPVRASQVLRTVATAWASPSTSCPPPMGIAGCGDQTADYTAVGPGRATVLATRQACGEAARCTGSAGRFELHVTVAG